MRGTIEKKLDPVLYHTYNKRKLYVVSIRCSYYIVDILFYILRFAVKVIILARYWGW